MKNIEKPQQLGPKYDEMTVADRAKTLGATRPALLRTKGQGTLTDEQREIILDGLRSEMTLAAVLIHNPD
ncbi:hypothetical protein, partial [Pseudomonas sp. GW460-12]|uniref:hypothetical protein n=1 Tax=Pseudomonas sp. GW460-12 TaxID=2070621 RepID=UPI001C4492D6